MDVCGAQSPTEYVGNSRKRRCLDRRRESSRYAARDRRGKEADIFMDLKEVVPIVDEAAAATHVDRIALLRVAATLCRMRQYAAKFLRRLNRRPLTNNFYGLDAEPQLAQRDDADIWTEETLAECLDGFALLADADGTILYVTESVNTFIGLTQTDLVGRHLKEFVHANDYEELTRVILAAELRAASARAHNDAGGGGDDLPDVLDTVIRMKTVISPRGRTLNFKSALYKAIMCRCQFVPEGCESSGAMNDGVRRLTLIYGMSTPAGQGTLLNGAAIRTNEVASGMFTTRHTCDMRFTYISDNLNLLLRHNSRSLMGASFYEFVHPADLDKLSDAIRELFRKGHTQTSYYRMLGANGAVIWCETEAITVNHTTRGQKGQYVFTQSELDSWNIGANFIATNEINSTDGMAELAVGQPVKTNVKREIPDVAEYFGRQPEFIDCADFTPLIKPSAAAAVAGGALFVTDLNEFSALEPHSRYARPQPELRSQQASAYYHQQPQQSHQQAHSGAKLPRNNSFDEVLQWLFQDENFDGVSQQEQQQNLFADEALDVTYSGRGAPEPQQHRGGAEAQVYNGGVMRGCVGDGADRAVSMASTGTGIGAGGGYAGLHASMPPTRFGSTPRTGADGSGGADSNGSGSMACSSTTSPFEMGRSASYCRAGKRVNHYQAGPGQQAQSDRWTLAEQQRHRSVDGLGLNSDLGGFATTQSGAERYSRFDRYASEQRAQAFGQKSPSLECFQQQASQQIGPTQSEQPSSNSYHVSAVPELGTYPMLVDVRYGKSCVHGILPVAGGADYGPPATSTQSQPRDPRESVRGAELRGSVAMRQQFISLSLARIQQQQQKNYYQAQQQQIQLDKQQQQELYQQHHQPQQQRSASMMSVSTNGMIKNNVIMPNVLANMMPNNNNNAVYHSMDYNIDNAYNNRKIAFKEDYASAGRYRNNGRRRESIETSPPIVAPLNVNSLPAITSIQPQQYEEYACGLIDEYGSSRGSDSGCISVISSLGAAGDFDELLAGSMLTPICADSRPISKATSECDLTSPPDRLFTKLDDYEQLDAKLAPFLPSEDMQELLDDGTMNVGVEELRGLFPNFDPNEFLRADAQILPELNFPFDDTSAYGSNKRDLDVAATVSLFTGTVAPPAKRTRLIFG